MKNYFKMDKVDQIAQLIKEKGVTKNKVAERCEINPATLSKILSRKIDYVASERLDRIVNYLEAVNTNEV